MAGWRKCASDAAEGENQLSSLLHQTSSLTRFPIMHLVPVKAALAGFLTP